MMCRSRPALMAIGSGSTCRLTPTTWAGLSAVAAGWLLPSAPWSVLLPPRTAW
ncbi:UNVERIFIED_CONTAM: hypothetical protein GTU68_053510 [Idotea baltica]|nr:hypothetical protein [Idotea baltica]